MYPIALEGVRVFLIDTPGFNDTFRSDLEVLENIAYWLAALWSEQTKLAGLIYLHDITSVRFTGSAMRNLSMFKKLTGSNNLNSVILATTHWTNYGGIPFPEDIGAQRVQELTSTNSYWGDMVIRGSKVERHDGTSISARRIVSEFVARKIRVVLDIQRFDRDWVETPGYQRRPGLRSGDAQGTRAL